MSVLGWRQWAVDRDGMLRPAWTPWSPFPDGQLLWRPDGVTQGHCLRGEHAPATPPPGVALAPGQGGETTGNPAGGAEAAGTVPHADCVCGLYAWRDPETLAASPYPRWTRLPIVVGVVRLGGRIVVGSRGMRAAFGYPVAVLDQDGVVSARYQVARYRAWPALVAEWHASEPSAAA